ncbi:MAG: copper resistance protein CopC [Corynebacterium sp.]|nr:copper resistance protein CopC [Corynebacterium sp.]
MVVSPSESRSVRYGVMGVAAVGLCAAGMVLSPVASAHDAVVGGTVTDGEVLTAFPDRFTVEFSAVPREEFNTMAVSNQDSGEVLFSQEPVIEGRNLSIETPQGSNFGAGHYVLGFNITSSDGHATRGDISFSVDGPSEVPTTSASSAPTVEEPAGHEGVPASIDSLTGPMKIILAGGGILAAIAVLAVLMAKRRNYRD